MAAKTATRHPYAAIEHRVIDSAAFADLSPSAKLVLPLMARQLTRDNNGHLHATYSFMSRYGIGSEHTLARAVAELIAHGFIYRTRSHGANAQAAKYAVTWLSVTKRDGLFLAGFESCAWRNWQPEQKKSTQQKVQQPSCKKCSFTPRDTAQSAGTPPLKSADNELIPCRGGFSGQGMAAANIIRFPKPAGGRMPPLQLCA